MKLRLPNGLKLWGANLCCDVTTLQVGTGAWPAMWSAWDWDGWIKPQIDLMVGNGVGCNAIRCQGAAYAVQNGAIPMATYLARWSQLVEYCQARGVYVYPCGCTMDTDTNFALSASTMGAVFAQIFLHLQQYDNVPCIDILQETSQEDSSVWPARQAYLVAVLNDIKARGVTLPLTYSSGEFIDSGFPWLTAIGADLDYLDAHLYYHTVTATGLDTLLTTFPDKDFICGEVGAEVSWTTADGQLSQIKSTLNLLNGGHPNLRGALVWCATDPRTGAVAAGKAWGQYTEDHVPRQDRLNLLRRFTGGSTRRANQIR